MTTYSTASDFNTKGSPINAGADSINKIVEFSWTRSSANSSVSISATTTGLGTVITAYVEYGGTTTSTAYGTVQKNYDGGVASAGAVHIVTGHDQGYVTLFGTV